MKIKSVIAIVLLVGCAGYADTFDSWTGSVSDDWMVDGNWNGDTDMVPTGAVATARIWNSTNSTPSVPNNTVLHSNDVASLKNVWIGNSNDSNQSGDLTVQAGASLTTVDNVILENDSTLTSSGAISVGNVNGVIVRDNSIVTLKDGSTLNKISPQNSSSVTMEAGSSVTTINALAHSSHLNLNNSYTGNLTLNNDSTATINGTLDGELLLQSTQASTIGELGTVDGNVKVSAGDQLTVSGTITNGVFNVNQTGAAVIEATAKIYSDSADSWLYNTASVTWNVGEDGSVGTLWTTRNESSLGAYDGEWRYDGSTNLTVVLDGYDTATYGGALTVRLVSGIQSESTFADNVTFLLNGEEVTTFAYTENGTFTGVVPGSGETAPVAVSDSYDVLGGQVLTVAAAGVLENDIYTGSNTLYALLADTTTNGALNLSADGSFIYTPTNGFVGTDTFTYKAYTSASTSDVAQVTIDVADPAVPTYHDWGGASNDNWMVEANWSGDGIPTWVNATARIYDTVPDVSNNAVLYSGSTSSIGRVWIGDSIDTNKSGSLTIQSGASLTTDQQFILNNDSTLTSSGQITIGDVNGLQLFNTSSVTLNSGSTLNKMILKDNSSATLEAGSSVTELTSLNDSSQLTLNGTYTGNLTLYHTSSATINGTLDGDLLLQGTGMSTIGATGVVDGDVKVSTGDQLTVAGTITNGVFYVNQTGQAIIEPTAKIYSASSESWLYNDADVIWNVGADGSVGTLWTTNSTGIYTNGIWRYDGSTNLTVVLDAYDSATYGEELTVRLVSGIQSESTFANNVKFLRNGDEVSTFAYTGNGTFVGTVGASVIVDPPVLTSGINEAGNLVLGWNGSNGVSYAVQSSTNLVSGGWINIMTGLSGATIAVTNETTEPQEFFQVIVE